MKHRISKLALKFTIGFMLLGILICGTSALIGYTQYKSSIEKQYNDTAYQVGEVARSYVTLDMIEEYAQAAQDYRDGLIEAEAVQALVAEERYQVVQKQFAELRKGMGANDIFIATIDWEALNAYAGTKEGWAPMLYIFDSYAVEELSYVLGDSSPFNPEFMEETKALFTTGDRPDNYFISKSDYGYNTSAQLSIKNEEGKVIAAIGVEIPMTTIQSALRQYIIYAVLITVILIILFIAIYMIYLYRRVITPINQVAHEADSFIENRNQASEALTKIKTRDEIQNLSRSILKMQTDINNYIVNITQITAEKERIGAELDVAKHIQASMLPCIFPAFPDRKEIDIFATMDPAKEVGGDFYDFFMVDDRHLAIVMADVSGKGVPAALFMVIGKTLIKDHTMPGRDLGEVFSTVNNLLCEANSEGLFITAFEGVLDLMTGEFCFVNAGHEMPYICKKGGDFTYHKIRPGFVLAGMEDIRYRAGVMQLDVGDMIFQYTDGVTEATNAANELYGMNRLTQILNQVKDRKPDEILKAVKQDIDTFVGEAPQFDDITMLCLEFREKMKDPAAKSNAKEITLQATIDNVDAVTDFVIQAAAPCDFTLKAQRQINIAIDEIFSNIANYAYGSQVGEATVRVEIADDSSAVMITFIDRGTPYNPLEKDDPDTTLSAEERGIGGMGIFMVKNIMDDMSYEYKDSCNMLTIRKNK